MIAYFRENILTLLAVVMIALLLVGYLLFAGIVLWPQWQTRTALMTRLDAAEAAISQPAQDVPNTDASSDAPNFPVPDNADEAAALFLTEQQAADLLQNLANYADASGVNIVDLQAQPSANDGQKSVYDVRQFRLSLSGEMVQLMDFVARLRETAVSSIQLANLQMADGSETDTLTLDLLLYTSPYANGTVLADLPQAPTPLPQPTASPPEITPADALAEQIHEPWSQENWSATIDIIEQILAIDASYSEMSEKLYAAHVNYGYQMLEQGDEAGAKLQFEQALAINANGEAAMAGLQALADPVATAQPMRYQVQQGDTLFSIARRFGVSVDVLRAANGLTDNTIATGQELLIP